MAGSLFPKQGLSQVIWVMPVHVVRVPRDTVRAWALYTKAGIAFCRALADNAASSGEASSAKDCGGWTTHGSRSRVDGDPGSG
jgi:hypothetical protein